MSLRVTVVANVVARLDAEHIISIIQHSAPKSVDLTIARTTRTQTATHLAESHCDETDLFIAIGGDGTVSEVAAGIGERSIPLAIIPAGSTNIIAREQRIPTSPREAVALAFGPHRIKHIDMGYCNDFPFLHMAGMGLDAYMFEFSSRKLKKQLGWAAYFPAVGRALMQGTERYRITADGEQFEAESPLILVASGSSVLSPKIQIHPDIKSDDGYLDLVVFEANTPLAILRTISEFVGRTLSDSPYVTHRKVKQIEIESKSPVPVEVDGDVVTTTPVSFSITPGSVGLVVPVR